MNSVLLLGGAIIALLILYIAWGAWLSRRWHIRGVSNKMKDFGEEGIDQAYSSAPVSAGHTLSALAGAGAIQGTVAAAVFGWLPVILWLILSSALFGCVQHFATLIIALRNKRKSFTELLATYLSLRSARFFLLLLWIAVVILSAVLLDAGTSAMTGIIPITGGEQIFRVNNGQVTMAILFLIPAAIFLGFLNQLGLHGILSTLVAVVLIGAACALGVLFPLYLGENVLLVLMLLVAAVGSILPIWLLQQSRGFMSSLLILLLTGIAVIGIFVSSPTMSLPAFTGIYEQGDWIFPVLFAGTAAITLSGFGGMWSGSITAREIRRQNHTALISFLPLLFLALFAVVVVVVMGSASSSDLAASSPFDAFVSALLSLTSALGLPSQWEIPIQVLFMMAMVLMILAAMDACFRMGSLAFAQFCNGGREQGQFPFRVCGAVLTGVVVFALTQVRYENLEMIAGLFLILLVVPVCGCVRNWMRQAGFRSGVLLLPIGASTLLGVGLFVFMFMQDMLEVADAGFNRDTIWTQVQMVLLLLGLVCLLIFTVDSRRSHMKKKQMVFATKNEGKMKEIREIMGDLDMKILSMEEAGIDIPIEENGDTFEANALIKARAVSEEAGCLVLADDSGLVIDALNGQPGVHSARYLGEDTSYEIKNQKILEQLQDVPEDQRSARFVCVIAAVYPDGRVLVTRETMEGYIGYEAKGENGFGYDPIFYLPEYGCSSAELSLEEKNMISHRGKALREIKERLNENSGNQ